MIVLKQVTRGTLRISRVWEPKIGETVAEVRIKKMKTLWGSCNARGRRIWVNLELVKKPPACLECILVHEMVHFWERQHNERFRERMDAVMPRGDSSATN